MKEFLDMAQHFRETPIVDDFFPAVRDKFDRTLERLRETLPTVVCLCGSTRFKEAFDEANYRETMAGRIVLSVGFYMHATGNRHGESVGATPEQKIALDELHKRKIDLADEVLILNVGGYIGDSTRSELEYARAHGKAVRWLEPHRAIPPGCVQCSWVGDSVFKLCRGCRALISQGQAQPAGA